jgi:hypothetical protein
VHTPEFAFEHVLSNVRTAVHSLGVDNPVAVDSNYATWDAYNNEYWPADYLIDPTGQVRVYDYREGGYSTMETDIRELLTANGATRLPPRTDVVDKTPTRGTSPERLDQRREAVEGDFPDRRELVDACASLERDLGRRCPNGLGLVGEGAHKGLHSGHINLYVELHAPGPRAHPESLVRVKRTGGQAY